MSIWLHILILMAVLNPITLYFILDFFYEGCYEFVVSYDIYLNPIKEKITPLIIKVGYNFLYGFSVCQIEFNKIINKIKQYTYRSKKYLKDNNIIIDVKSQTLKIINKNGNIENTLFITDKTPITMYKNIFDSNIHSGIVLFDKNCETGCVNNIFYENLPDNNDYKLSKISFMAVILEHEDIVYDIILKDNSCNYYIINNYFNQYFFKYYIKNVLKKDINVDNFDYNVTIIDHNVNLITLLPHQTIIIGENDYTIYPDEKQIDTQTNTLITNIVENNHNSENDSEKSDDFIKLDTND